jgi:hypothetical protein
VVREVVRLTPNIDGSDHGLWTRRSRRTGDLTAHGQPAGGDRADAMMGAAARARHTALAPYLKRDHKAIGSINSQMRCILNAIYAQYLQLHKDPVTGEETVVFSCFNKDRSLDHVDWSNLRTRLSQNGVQEKLTKQWIDRCLRQIGAREELLAQ